MFKQITTNFTNNKAFSLTEILITIGVISVLTAMAVTTYSKYNIRAESAAAMQQLEYYQKAAQTYYLENNVMPSTIDQLNVSSAAINNISINLSQSSPTTVKINAVFNNNVTTALRNKSINMEVTSNPNTSGLFNVTCTGGGTASCPGEPSDSAATPASTASTPATTTPASTTTTPPTGTTWTCRCRCTNLSANSPCPSKDNYEVTASSKDAVCANLCGPYGAPMTPSPYLK